MDPKYSGDQSVAVILADYRYSLYSTPAQEFEKKLNGYINDLQAVNHVVTCLRRFEQVNDIAVEKIFKSVVQLNDGATLSLESLLTKG